MKIANIDLSWFRGASERVLLETDGKSVVIYGDNASVFLPQEETNFFVSDPPDFQSSFQSWRPMQYLLRHL